MKIVFCGYGRAALECIYQLVSVYNIDLKNINVYTHDAQGNENFIKHLINNKIKYNTENINNFHKELVAFSPDYLVSIYYRYIIKKNILKIVDYKAMNSHPSLLPAYRGTKSSVWAILNNEQETGITYHYINEKIDDGNIILQKTISISNDDTAYSLYNKLISLFVLNFCSAFDMLINNNSGFKQRGKPTYYKRELPFNGKLNIENTNFLEAKLFVRAMYFPPHKGALFIKKNGKEIEIRNLKSLEKFKTLFIK